MRWIQVFSIMICITAGLVRKGSAQTMSQTIDELLKAYNRQDAFNGCALISLHGQVLLEKGYGYATPAARIPIDTNTIFQIGSITKQFTSIAILRLIEQKKLGMQDKLSEYISDYPQGEKITIENLLTHTAGIYNYTANDSFMSKANYPVRRESLIGFFKNRALDFAPGSSFKYSNSGYVLLGYIIEKITGNSFFTVMRDTIFKPLQMSHSGFATPPFIDSHEHAGFISSGKKYVDSSVSFAAGSMYSTVGDLYKWNCALLAQKFVHDSTLQKTYKTSFFKFGYGWLIDSAYGKQVILQQGSTAEFSAFFARIPDQGTCIILLDNRQSPELAKIGEDINAIVNDQPYEWPKVKSAFSIDSKRLQKYCGVYSVTPDVQVTVMVEGGVLKALMTGNDKMILNAETSNLFFVKASNVQIEFVNSTDSIISALIVHQDGKDLIGKKIR